jgi:DNA modification methylase
MQVTQTPVSEIIPYANNSRTHSEEQVAQIAASIREFGFNNPVLLDGDKGIIAGHGRVLAARKLGLDTVPTIELSHLTKTQRKAYIIADNKLALNAGWNLDLLALEMKGLGDEGFDLSLIGFNQNELASLLADKTVGLTDPDSVPETPDSPRDPVSRPGDLWVLGKHRLLCGDSTDPLAVARVMDGARASLVFTSPPYGNQRDYTTGGIGDWDALMRGVFGVLPVADDAQVLVNLGLIHRDNEWQPYWQGWLEWMREKGWRRFGLYVWDQGPGLPGDWNGRLAPSFELVFHFNRTARKPNKIVPCKWAGHIFHDDDEGGLRNKDGSVGGWTHAGKGVQDMRIPDNVIRITRHKARGIETEHPAVFPVKLPEFVMRAYSDDGAVVYEPFAGSGTGIVAGQHTGRRVRAIELAPEYVDVVLLRWAQLFPDLPAMLDGRPFDDVAAERKAAAGLHGKEGGFGGNGGDFPVNKSGG